MVWLLIFVAISGTTSQVTHSYFQSRQECVLAAEQTVRVFGKINYEPEFKFNWSCVGVKRNARLRP